jgi:hypothetical protein
MHEGEVASSNPTGHVACEFYAKNVVTYEDGRALAAGGLLGKKLQFFRVFFCFQLCRVSDKKHSVKTALPTIFYRVTFAKCYTRQSICRVQLGLCRVSPIPVVMVEFSHFIFDIYRRKKQSLR